MNMLKALFAALCLLMLSLTSVAALPDLIESRAYLEDPSNALSLDQVKQRRLTPYRGMLAKGYSRSTFWVKLNIQAAPDLTMKAAPIILRIEPTYLDEIELYDPLEPGKQNRFAGDRHSWNDYEYKSLVFNFVIPAAKTSREVWLRLKTTSTNMISVRAVSLEEEQKSDQQYIVVTVLLFISVLMFVMWGAVYWALHRDFLIGIFAVKQLIGLAFVSTYVGYFRLFFSDYFSAPTLDCMNSSLVLLTTFTTIWFHFEFFRDYQLKRWARFFFYGLLLASPIELALVAAGDLTGGLKLNMLAVMLVSPFMLMAVLTSVDWEAIKNNPAALPKPIMIGFHALFFVVASITAVPSLGIVSLTSLAPHFVMIHGFLTGLVMMVMLHYRNKRLYDNQILAIGLANQQAQHERSKRDEERRFLEMLTHELKTSLSVIRMAIGTGGMDAKFKAYADNAILDVSQVMERCLQVQEAGDGKLSLNKEHVDIAILLEGLLMQYAERADFKLEISGSSDVQTDLKLLKVLLSNLIDNAVKYGAPKQPIVIHVARVGESLVLEVINAPGIVGMPDPGKVFEKYYRSEQSHGIIGSGLGLYLMKNIARLMGGDLHYQPIEGRVKFVLSIPV